MNYNFAFFFIFFHIKKNKKRGHKPTPCDKYCYIYFHVKQFIIIIMLNITLNIIIIYSQSVHFACIFEYYNILNFLSFGNVCYYLNFATGYVLFVVMWYVICPYLRDVCPHQEVAMLYVVYDYLLHVNKQSIVACYGLMCVTFMTLLACIQILARYLIIFFSKNSWNSENITYCIHNVSLEFRWMILLQLVKFHRVDSKQFSCIIQLRLTLQNVLQTC